MKGTDKPMNWWFVLRIESYNMDSLPLQAAVIKAVESIGWIGSVEDFYTVRSECFIQAHCIWPEFQQIREFVWLLQDLVSGIKIYSIYFVKGTRVREIHHLNQYEANCIDIDLSESSCINIDLSGVPPASSTALTLVKGLEEAIEAFTGHIAWCTISFKGKNWKKNQKRNSSYEVTSDEDMLHEMDPNILEGGEGF